MFSILSHFLLSPRLVLIVLWLSSMANKRKAEDWDALVLQFDNDVPIRNQLMLLDESLYCNLIGFSHLGCGCKICEIPLTLTETAITRHLAEQHRYSVQYEVFEAFAHATIQALQQGHWADNTINSGIRALCGCGNSYTKFGNAVRHCEQSTNQWCNPDDIQKKVLMHQFPCFRWVLLEPEASTPLLLSSQEQVFASMNFPTYSEVEQAIRPFVRVDENMQVWIPLFAPLVSEYQPFTSELIRQHVGFMSTTTISDDLNTLLVAAEQWIKLYARHNVSMIPGNLRADLLLFETVPASEQYRQNTTFTFRHNEEALIPELKKLLVFAYRMNHVEIPTDNQYNATTVAKILCDLFLEPMPTFWTHTVVLKYCLFRAFKIDSNVITMIQCGTVAKCMAVILSMMRSAICTMLCYTLEDVDTHANVLITRARTCRNTNMLSPAISNLRRMQSTKPSTIMHSISANGDVIVDAYTIPKRHWERVIPTVVDLLDKLLPLLCAGDWFQPVVMIENSIGVTVDTVTFCIHINGILGTFHETAERMYIENFRGLLEYSFHSLGGGSMRHAELDRLTITELKWFNNAIHYYSVPIKQFSVRLPSGKPVHRQLPKNISRYYLCYRLFTQHMQYPSRAVLPVQNAPHYTMKHAVADIYHLQGPLPNDFQIRQMTTSILNAIFPNTSSGNSDVLVTCLDEIAELSGHTTLTHAQHYGSIFTEGHDILIHKLHHALGFRDTTMSIIEAPNPANMLQTV